jgi:hypothetical protein
MWAVYERLGNDGHIKHECTTTSKEIATGNREKGGDECPQRTYGKLSVRYMDDSAGGPCILGEESIDKT